MEDSWVIDSITEEIREEGIEHSELQTKKPLKL